MSRSCNRSRLAADLVGATALVLGLATTACRSQSAVRPSEQASAGKRQGFPAVADHEAPKHSARPRAWRVRADSPFALVGEGLKDADVLTLGKPIVIYAAPCTWTAAASGNPPDSYTVYGVDGERFLTPLPSSPKHVKAHGGATLTGRWPDLWLRYDEARKQAGAQYQFFHWDGTQWQTIPAGSASTALEPYDVFDWYDGAKLVTQIQKWHYSVSYAVAPFLVWGHTSHPAPDFSTLPFPRDLRRELQLASVEYATLPTHEVFALHSLVTHDDGHSIVTVAYSTQTGALVQEKLVDAAGSSAGRFATGRLDQREVIVAWGDLKQFGRYRSWMQLYDGTSSVRLPVPEPAMDKSELANVWFAGGRLWARRGDPSNLWQFDGTSWTRFAQVSVGATLTWSVEDGSLWGSYGTELFRIQRDGRKVTVPFLAEPTKEPLVLRLVATAPDDVWLIVTTEDDDLIFRTRKMTSILTCK